MFVFFAGHGYTKTGMRGEVGYLVPYDADTNNLRVCLKFYKNFLECRFFLLQMIFNPNLIKLSKFWSKFA